MKFKKIYNTLGTQEKIVFEELDLDNLKKILNEEKDKHIVIKFGATWCGPCKKIESTLFDCFLDMPENVICFDLDVDDNFELFGKLKSKKAVNTIPAILYYNCKNDREDKWYLSDGASFSSDKVDVLKFFKQIYKNF